MILKGQYFEADGGAVYLAMDDQVMEPIYNSRRIKTSNGKEVASDTNSPLTVRRMFELLECPVPEGAKVVCIYTHFGLQWLYLGEKQVHKVIDGRIWAIDPMPIQALDLSNLPVTDEVIESLPEPLQKKWKELL